MIETARKEDLFLDKKLIIPENKLDAIRIMARLHPVVGDQPTHEKDQPNTNNPILDLACTIANIHEKGIGVHADLRSIQNEPPEYYFGKGFMSGISSLKGNGILVVFGQWRDGSGRYAIKQFYYTDKEISYRNAISDTTWSSWIDVLTSNSSLDYNKLLNVPITSTLSDDKTKIASIFAVNNVNRAAVNAQKTANRAQLDAVDAMNEAKKKLAPGDYGLGGVIRITESNINEFSDLNDLTSFIFASVRTDNLATKIANMPERIVNKCFIQVLEGTTEGECLQIVTHYRSGLQAHRVFYAYSDIWSDWIYGYTTANTTEVKGFLRISGNLIPLTEDQLTSTLSDAKDKAASIYSVNQINRAVNTAQKTANNADAKAGKAQNTADNAIEALKLKADIDDLGILTTKSTDRRGFIAKMKNITDRYFHILNRTTGEFEFGASNLEDSDPDSIYKFPYRKGVNFVATLDQVFQDHGYLGTVNLDNLNSPEHAGVYYQTSNADALAIRNYPVDKAGSLFVLLSAASSGTRIHVSQVYICYNASNNTYIRNNYGGKWSSWTKLLHENDVIPIDKGGTGATTAANARKNLGIQTTNMLVVTGTIAHGSTIPIPSGFSVNECSFFVSTDKMNPEEEKWDIQETSEQMHFKSECFVSNRVVTCRMWVGTHYGPTHATDPSRWINGIANYIVIGVKK